MAEQRPRGLIAVLTLATAFGIVALVLSVQNALANDRQDEQRERDRIEADVEGCERGNENRRTQLAIATANEAMVTSILDLIFTTSAASADPDRVEQIAEFRRRLDGPIRKYHDAVAAIRITDCADAIPGAQEAP